MTFEGFPGVPCCGYSKEQFFYLFGKRKISAIFGFTLFVFGVRYEVIFLLAEGVAFFKIQVE